MAGREQPKLDDIKYDVQQQQLLEVMDMIDKIQPPDQKELDRRRAVAAENKKRKAQGLPLKPVARIVGPVKIGNVKGGFSPTHQQWKINGIKQPGAWGEGGPPPKEQVPEFPGPAPKGWSPFHWEQIHKQLNREWDLREKLWPKDPGLYNAERQRTLRENMSRGAE